MSTLLPHGCPPPGPHPLPSPGTSTAGVAQCWAPTWRRGPRACSDPALTLLEVVQAPELHQAVAVIVVGDIDAVVLGCWVFHPGPLVASVAVVLRGGLH